MSMIENENRAGGLYTKIESSTIPKKPKKIGFFAVPPAEKKKAPETACFLSATRPG